MSKRYSIVGQKFVGVDAYNEGVLPGTPVTLVREPENQYDKNAVQVWIDGKRVGYLSSKQNAEIAAHIDRSGNDIPEPFGRLAHDAAGNVIARNRKAINATFARSPNSSYPQVEIDL